MVYRIDRVAVYGRIAVFYPQLTNLCSFRQTFHGHRYIAFVIDMVVGVDIIAVYLNRRNACAFCRWCDLAGGFLHRKRRFTFIKIAYFFRNPLRMSGSDIHIDPVCICIGQKITFCVFQFKITIAEKCLPTVCPSADCDFFPELWITVDDDLPGREDPGISLFHHNFYPISNGIRVEGAAVLKIIDDGRKGHMKLTVHFAESDTAFKLIHIIVLLKNTGIT